MPLSQNYNLRMMRNGEWFWVDKNVLRNYPSLIKASAIIVYIYLASMVDENQSCFQSQKYIADNLGCSRATVNRAIKKLAEQKLIAIERKDRIHFNYMLLHTGNSNSETKMSHVRNSPVSNNYTNNTNKQEINNNTVVCTTKEDLFAQDIADALKEPSQIETYRHYVRLYPEGFIRRILSEVKLTPIHKIRKSRHALFMYLIRYYAKTH